MFKKKPIDKPRMLFFDIESSSLNASFGYTLCVGFKWLGEKKIHVLAVDDYKGYGNDPTDDKEMLKAFSEIYNSADSVCGWYSKGFDTPFINTRLLYHKLPPLAPVAHLDAWWYARKKLKFHSNRLAAVADFFGVSDKTPVNSHWVKAQAGNRASLKYIKDHCIGDIKTLEAVYHRMLPIMDGHFNVNLVSDKTNGCPKCGKTTLQKRGFTIALTAMTQRYHCTSCGGWSKGRPVRNKNIEVR
jgi:uncharacterized protein YprB with RNaseH-like and TPR domain/predicted RNA-binding Zn-ribbon protein involved in translation (DUF1610 family)